MCVLLRENKLSWMIPYIKYVFMQMCYFCIYTVDVSLYRLSIAASHYVCYYESFSLIYFLSVHFVFLYSLWKINQFE